MSIDGVVAGMNCALDIEMARRRTMVANNTGRESDLDGGVRFVRHGRSSALPRPPGDLAIFLYVEPMYVILADDWG